MCRSSLWFGRAAVAVLLLAGAASGQVVEHEDEPLPYLDGAGPLGRDAAVGGDEASQVPGIGSIDPLAADPEPGEFPEEVPLTAVPPEAFPTEPPARPWEPAGYGWQASWLRHLPLYYEDVPLERYGHSFGAAQPFVSGARFYAQTILLPYQMGINRPLEPQYTLGLYQPGDYAPELIYPIPLSMDGAILMGGVYAAGFAIIP